MGWKVPESTQKDIISEQAEENKGKVDVNALTGVGVALGITLADAIRRRREQKLLEQGGGGAYYPPTTDTKKKGANPAVIAVVIVGSLAVVGGGLWLIFKK